MATATTTKPRKSAPPKPADVCRLTIEINDVAYRVSPIRVPREFGARRAYRLKRDAQAVHHVIEQIHGTECSCGDFVFRRDGIDPRGCKHIKALKAVGLL